MTLSPFNITTSLYSTLDETLLPWRAGRQIRARRWSSLPDIVAGCFGLTFPNASATATPRRSSPLPSAWRGRSNDSTWSACQAHRHWSWKPAFTQFHDPMERTSAPQWHRQSPLSIRLNCALPAMPQRRLLAADMPRRGGRMGPRPLPYDFGRPGDARGAPREARMGQGRARGVRKGRSPHSVERP